MKLDAYLRALRDALDPAPHHESRHARLTGGERPPLVASGDEHLRAARELQCSRPMRSLVCCLALAACYAETNQAPLDAPAAATGIPDVRCSAAPSLPGRELRHTKNELVVDMGEPRHRGVDLIATDTDDSQTIRGTLSYSGVDKALEDEDAELFACTGTGWQSLGTARTDDEGDSSSR